MVIQQNRVVKVLSFNAKCTAAISWPRKRMTAVMHRHARNTYIHTYIHIYIYICYTRVYPKVSGQAA